MIKKLKRNQIFVFGSNLAGIHAGGAARYAKGHFKAVEGIGEGPTGQCYAFPTLDKNFNQLNDERQHRAAWEFLNYARSNPNKIFLLTKVGCGIARRPEWYMKSLFKKSPENIIKPKGW